MSKYEEFDLDIRKNSGSAVNNIDLNSKSVVPTSGPICQTIEHTLTNITCDGRL